VIPVRPAPEPADFDARVRQPGEDAIRELTGQPPTRRRRGRRRKKLAERPEDIPPDRFPPYWRDALPDMLEAYERRCAYLALHIESATGAASVDHMVPKSRSWELVYEWRNYRLAAALINSKKREVTEVLDPFEIGPDWFALEFVAFQVVRGAGAVGDIAARVDLTIRRLGLNREACCKAREAYYGNYCEGNICVNYLRERAPFVEQEMRRQGRLRDSD
jgi:5-methylcytosine-specific restriction endonuclease McrA